EEVFRLHIDARHRDPANERRGQRVPDLYVAQPDVGAALDVIAADLPAEDVVVVDSRILRVRVSRVGAPLVSRLAPGIVQQVVADVRREVAEDVEVLLVVEDLIPERAEHSEAQVPGAPPQREIQARGEIRMVPHADREVCRTATTTT